MPSEDYRVEWDEMVPYRHSTSHMTADAAFEKMDELLATPGKLNPRIVRAGPPTRRYVQLSPEPNPPPDLSFRVG